MTDSNSRRDDRKAWGNFWAQNAGAGAGGCLPERWTAIEDAQRSCWQNFVRDIPEGAAILDLATGDGRVLRWMRETRPDLDLTGIDLADQLPPAPEGTVTRGGVAMEELPFEPHKFGSVVSQFGFEYGDIGPTAAEIARVLSPGGTVGLMVHRGDGPILEHNIPRREAIEWVMEEKKVGAVVRTALESPDGGPNAAAQVCAVFARLGANKFGSQSPAWEIPEAMRRAVVLGIESGASTVIQTIGIIESRAENEVGRIASLARACANADNRDSLVAAFTDRGIEHQGTKAVQEPSGRPLADFLTFRLPG